MSVSMMASREDGAPTHHFHSTRELIDHRAATSPKSVAMIDPESNVAVTYAHLQSKVRAVAQAISACGVKPGEAVAYATSNSPDAAISIFGILYGGYLATAINLVAGKNVISYVLEHSETKLIISDEIGLSILKESLNDANDIPVLNISADLFEEKSAHALHFEQAGSGGLLMYTSGTTGRPKGVVLSHENLIAGGQNTALAHELSDHDCALCVLPLYHINGLCVTIMGALVSGSCVVIAPKFSVSNFWQTVIDHKCSWFSVVPTQISYLLHNTIKSVKRDQLNNVRFGRSASAPLSPDVQSAFEKKFGIAIVETMGLTETAAQILSNPLPPGIRKIGSPGVAYGNEICIGDNNQNEVARGTEGEILVRGPNVMQCYLKDEDATSQAITADKWLRTGDLGKMDEDGYVTITGRLKELIIKGGENIAPREIDDALYSHADVVEAAAFARKCDRYGERVEAAVKISEGSTLTQNLLIELCRDKLGAFKAPDCIYFLPELPKGPSGKIQRIRLSEICAQQSS